MTEATAKKKPIEYWQRVVIHSILAYFAFGIALNFIHEGGHAAFCEGESYVGVTAAGGYTVCRGPDTFLFSIMGPVFGVGASVVLAVVSWRYRQKLIGVFVAAVAFVPDQSAKVVLEGFYSDLYLSGTIDGWMTMMQLGSLFALMILFTTRRQQKQ
jgi:hypothetical protein